MDLISRKAVKDITIHLDVDFANSFDPHTLNEVRNLTENLPSAFEGMTNGEIIKALFPNVGIVHDLNYLLRTMQFTDDWWDSPYKGVSE